MRDHELELIAALVEGRLEDEAEAHALIESSAEHRKEYEAQKLAYEALRQVGTESLSDVERSALHRDVWADLRSGTTTKPAGTPWYLRWAPVAAGFLVVIGLVAVLSQIEDNDSLQTAADLTATTGAAGAPEAADGSGRGEAADTLNAEESGIAEADDSGADLASVYAEEAARIREGDFTSQRLQTFDESRSEDVETCLVDAGLDDHRIVATLAEPEGGTSETNPEEARAVAVIPEGAEISTAPITFVELHTCEIVFFDG